MFPLFPSLLQMFTILHIFSVLELLMKQISILRIYLLLEIMHVMSVNTMHKHDIKHDYEFISLITLVINYKFKRASQSNVQLNDNFE